MDPITTFDQATAVALVTVIYTLTQWAKTISERGETWKYTPEWARPWFTRFAHSWGPAVISLVLSLCAVTLPGIIADGALTWPEVGEILEGMKLAGAANMVHWVVRFKSPAKLFKKRK